ncbi:MAG: hypothetical protein CSA58_00060 [Micrococcales bacterium]|nr:MAG: hypothetical protein CSB46_07890 [Micrococcales bacterium]PIE28242.1 MAG: hypothetical protein CSA58_00060 [Micrococcales bacterium]
MIRENAAPADQRTIGLHPISMCWVATSGFRAGHPYWLALRQAPQLCPRLGPGPDPVSPAGELSYLAGAQRLLSTTVPPLRSPTPTS